MIGTIVRLVALFFVARRILRLASQRRVSSSAGGST